MTPSGTRGLLRAWCEARPAEEAAGELYEAMVDDEDPDLWRLGLEALSMIEQNVAEHAVRHLLSHPGLGPLATTLLGRQNRQ